MRSETASAVSHLACDQRLARAMVTPCARSPLHPNHLTLVALLLGLTAAGIGAPLFALWLLTRYLRLKSAARMRREVP